MGWWGKVTGQKKYQHISYSRTLTQNQPDISIPFIAAGTQTVDSIRIMLGNAAGNVATTVKIHIIDSAQNRQVGNARQVVVGAGAAYVANVVSGFAAGLQKFRSYRLEVLSTTPNINALTAPAQANAVYTMALQVGGFAHGAIPANWRITLDSNWCIPMGGFAGYQASGDANRTLNVMVSGAALPAEC